MKTYVVRPGDTLWKISKATGVKLHLLLAANPQIQDPNHLKPGEVIVIPELGKPSASTQPSASPPDQTAPGPYLGFVWPHVVGHGDTWASLAQQYGVPVAQIEALNSLHQGRPLQPGEIIYIPMVSSPLAAPAEVTADGTAAAPPVPEPGMPPAADQAMPAIPGEPMSPVGPEYAEPAPFEPPGVGPHTHYPYRAPWSGASSWGYPVPGLAWRAAGTGFPYGHPYPYMPMPQPLPFGFCGPWHIGAVPWWHEVSLMGSSWTGESSLRAGESTAWGTDGTIDESASDACNVLDDAELGEFRFEQLDAQLDGKVPTEEPVTHESSATGTAG